LWINFDLDELIGFVPRNTGKSAAEWSSGTDFQVEQSERIGGAGMGFGILHRAGVAPLKNGNAHRNLLIDKYATRRISCNRLIIDGSWDIDSLSHCLN
jgi:hypothetical protein